MLPPVVQAFRDQWPDIELVTADVGIAELVAGLRDGRFDAAFTRPPLVEDLVTRTWRQRWTSPGRVELSGMPQPLHSIKVCSDCK